MDWLNEPNVEEELDGFCTIRVCPSNHHCDNYVCGAFFCRTKS